MPDFSYEFHHRHHYQCFTKHYFDSIKPFFSNAMSKIDVLLADNQPLTAAGIRYWLDNRSEFRIVGEVANSADFQTLVDSLKPVLLIADYNISGFITADDLRAVKEISPSTNTLIISSDSNRQSITQVLQTGVTGYLTKETSREEFMMAVQATARGEKFYSHRILNIIMEKSFNSESAGRDISFLTVREKEILALLAKGKSTQHIADEIHLSPHTVHTHRKSIIRKLGIKSPTQFVIHAIDLNLIKI